MSIQPYMCTDTHTHTHTHMHALAQSAGAVEYTYCFSAEEYPIPRNECPQYVTQQSEGDVPVMLELWGMWNILFIAIARRSTLARSGST